MNTITSFCAVAVFGSFLVLLGHTNLIFRSD